MTIHLFNQRCITGKVLFNSSLIITSLRCMEKGWHTDLAV